jgi:hypothetical protein
MHNKPYPGVVSHYICDTMEEVWRLFTTYDVHAARTEQQCMHARRGLFSDERLNTIPSRILQPCGTALYFLGAGTDPVFRIPPVHTKSEKADLVDKYPDDVAFVARYRDCKHLMVVGCMTAMVATFRKSQEAAAVFWDKVATGEMMLESDPRRRLRDSMLDMRFLERTKGGVDRYRAIYVVAISWWNTWRKGTTRKMVQISQVSNIPKVSE